jgi:serine protease Do
MLVGALITGVVMSLPQGIRSDAYAEQLGASIAARQSLTTAQDLSTSFRNVAEALKPSVVSISTTQNMTSRARSVDSLPPGLRRQLPPGFEDLFGFGDDSRRQQPQREGMGSGVIVRSDGYILTNNHVVENADELIVELSDRREVPGKIVGTDPETDLAVVKIDLVGLQPATLGSSDDIRVGDWVLAIGSPFGLNQTVTAGIISGKNRVQGIVDDGNGFEDFLQTDAAINPGNSGGPLVNLRGELVGINTAILSRTGASAGIGFAIPVSLAQPVLNSIIESGQVRRGFLGAAVADVTPEFKKEYDLKAEQGAFVRSVLEDQPADKAGLQPGDVVTSLDGRPCIGGTQLRNYVASRPPGTVVKMGVDRGGKPLQIQVNLQERTHEMMSMFSPGSNVLGAELEPVTSETARQFGYQGLTSGLIVTSVADDSLAARAQLQAGDIIESAGGIELNSVAQLTQLFTEAKKREQTLRLVIRRGNTRMLLGIR